jgi:O-antigen biosynthesis protein
MALPNPLAHPVWLTTPRRLVPSTWLQLVPFGMYVVEATRPSSVVELGAYSGVSYCCFCQAVQALRLPTACHAIDTWEGDPHGGYFGGDVLRDLRAHHDPLYGDFSVLVQSTFDAAVSQFPDRSIDLLHIDGHHTYEAVRHDFEMWLPKLSERGVILFHDIAIRDADFGVWRLWQELRGRYPSFELTHGCGLGVLGAGPNLPSAITELMQLADVERAVLQKFFHRLGSSLETDLECRGYREQFAAFARRDATRTRHSRPRRLLDRLLALGPPWVLPPIRGPK